MSRILYVDCVGGIAGDMFLAALIDVGADVGAIEAGLAALPLDDVELVVSTAERHGIAAKRVEVVSRSDGHPYRGWREVSDLVDGADLPERAKRIAEEAFARLAHAEGRIHGVAPEEVHFHEVGATDAIGDVCGVSLALHELGVERVSASPLPASVGVIEAGHGHLPLPAPAALELLRGAKWYGTDIAAELVTPTGAALLATVADDYGPMPPMELQAIGYGAGRRDLVARPNVVRVVLGSVTDSPALRPVSMIEANIDDLAPELVPDATQACFAAGAVDVWTVPAQMKKGRPGIVLSALARPEREQAVIDAMFRTTTTLGVRITHLERQELERRSTVVEIKGEPVRVKLSFMDGDVASFAPEHDDCVAVAERTGQPVRDVWQAALEAARARGIPSE